MKSVPLFVLCSLIFCHGFIVEASMRASGSDNAAAYNSSTTPLENQNALLQTKASLAKEVALRRIVVGAAVIIVIALAFALGWTFSKNRKKLDYATKIDSLTDLNNRTSFLNEASARIETSKQQGVPAAIILLDIDHFKHVNDRFGFQIGDWSVKAVARAMLSTLNNTPITGRVDGDEMAILLDNTSASEAKKIAETLRATITEIDTHATKCSFTITASFGVCDTGLLGYSVDNLLSAADLALHQAKRSGRNRVYEYKNNMSFNVSENNT